MNVSRHRFDETNPTSLPCDVGTVIEIGDLLYLEVDDVRPITMATQTTVNTTRIYVHDRFAGVALSRHRAGDALLSVVVATSGVFEFPTMPSGFAYNAGDLVTPGFGVAPNLVAQVVLYDPQQSLAIGAVERTAGLNQATVLVRIISTKFAAGGAQFPA